MWRAGAVNENDEAEDWSWSDIVRPPECCGSVFLATEKWPEDDEEEAVEEYDEYSKEILKWIREIGI